MSLTVDSKVAVMSDDEISGESSSPDLGDVCSPGSELLSPQELDRIMGRVRDQNLRLVGEGGVVSLLSKKILERALEEEPTVDAGYERGDPAGRGSANSRNSVYPQAGGLRCRPGRLGCSPRPGRHVRAEDRRYRCYPPGRVLRR